MRGTPIVATDELITVTGRFTVGASGAHTKTAGGKNITSVTRTAAGKYEMLFTEVPFGKIVSAYAQHWPQAGVEPKVIAPTQAGYTASTKKLLWEASDIDETATLIELPSGDEVSYTVTWLKTT